MQWRTGWELNTLGFHILRSDTGQRYTRQTIFAVVFDYPQEQWRFRREL